MSELLDTVLCPVGTRRENEIDPFKGRHYGEPETAMNGSDGEREMCPWAISMYFGD
jgi:hypothetical protein